MMHKDTEQIIGELQISIHSTDSKPRLSDYFHEFQSKNIIIYGAGYVGKYACDILINNNIVPLCFFDEHGDVLEFYSGIPIKKITQNLMYQYEKDDTIVIVCAICDSDMESKIIDNLNEHGYKNIFLFKQKAFSEEFILKKDAAAFEPLISDYCDEILSCANLFADKESLNTFQMLMAAFCSRCFDAMTSLSLEQQYFPPDISFSRGYSRFVDCGAYSGDTILKLVGKNHNPRAIFAFEPDLQNFRSLADTVDRLNVENCYLFPCGLSSITETVRFKTDPVYCGAASSLDPEGDCTIQCVALDDVLKGVKPTFIKMDIEGAEYKALLGAKGIVTKYTPDLAICVYHYIDHYFTIPLLINSWNLGYQFYLRTYDAYGNETVLYATMKQ